MVIQLKTVLLLSFAIVFVGSYECGWGSETKGHNSAKTTLYADDPNHLWNRLHEAFLIRQGPDKLFYGQDRLEPLLWLQSEYLLRDADGERCVAILEEFLHHQGEKMIDLPLKRATLQRDLWLIFSWLEGTAISKPQQKLETLLAKAIQRLALTKEQIADLPDNYRQAVSSKYALDKFTSERPLESYLPSDLFEADGPWVSVGVTKGPTAPLHLRDGGNPFTNSTFLIFLKLPDGREATLAFLEQLEAMAEPLFITNTNEETKQSFPYVPQPKIPAWPKGTEVALVRRALLIDSKSRVVASPITESIQIRVTSVQTPKLTAEILNKVGSRNANEWHAALEFQLRRKELFEGTHGGLRDVSAERDFKTGFNSHPWDEFDRAAISETASGGFPTRNQPFKQNRDSCIICHNFPGVYSFNSLGLVPGRLLDPEELARFTDTPRPASRTVAEVENAAIAWKEEQASWKSLVKQFQK